MKNMRINTAFPVAENKKGGGEKLMNMQKIYYDMAENFVPMLSHT